MGNRYHTTPDVRRFQEKDDAVMPVAQFAPFVDICTTQIIFPTRRFKNLSAKSVMPAQHPPPDAERPEEDDGLSEGDDLPDGEEEATQKKFTASQIEYMEQRKEEYKESTHAERAEITNGVIEEFAKRIESTGRILKVGERLALSKVSEDLGRPWGPGTHMALGERSQVVFPTVSEASGPTGMEPAVDRASSILQEKCGACGRTAANHV